MKEQFYALVLLLSLLFDGNLAQVSVELPGLGTVEGNVEQTSGGVNFNVFRGVPYAEPPVGDLRFARPRPKASWQADGTLETKEFRAACPQTAPDPVTPGLTIDEDCLYLNILVPDGAIQADPANRFPVMIFIHSRGYRAYTGSEYNGQELATTGNIIVVTLDYRFLTFGFFSTDDDLAPGNYGLWDQRLAIEWVRDNIGAFGGDSSRITIVGQGREGATGVSSQILSPLNTNNLFQQAIIQSSQFTHITYIMPSDAAKRMSSRLADELNCNQTTWRQKLECLRSKTWEEILTASEFFTLGGYFEPRIDGYFFPEPLDYLLEDDQVLQYDIIAGVTSEEGVGLLNGYFDFNDFFQTVSDVTDRIFNEFLTRYGDADTAQLVSNAVAQEYLDPLVGLPDVATAHRYLIDFVGDDYYTANLIKFLRRHQESTEANTFMYYFDYVDEQFTFITDAPRDLSRAAQGEELFYLLDTVNGQASALSVEEGMASRTVYNNMFQYWVNFIRTGDPNAEGIFAWPQFTEESESYLWITNTVADTFLAVGRDLRADFTSFLLDYIPELSGSNYDEECLVNPPPSDTLRAEDDGDDAETEYVVITIRDDESELGQVRGILRTAEDGVGGRAVRGFRGIPYTLPPVGERRFRNSELLTDWGADNFLNATEQSPGCPQSPAFVLAPDSYSEDCLHLNIFAPEIPEGGDPLPVIFYVHSGQFRGGNGVVFDGTALASYTNAVVVTMNYRVLALGFLSTGDDVAPGNYGITDGVTALQWVQRYIRSFGGDPGNVMAFGTGSGTQIIHLIHLNGLNDDLFQRMILLGDSVISPIGLTSAERDPLQYAIELAELLDCPTESNSELITCLRGKSVDEIVSAPVGGSNTLLTTFLPRWDGTLLKSSPRELLQSGDYEAIPTIVGATENDNSIITALYLNGSLPNRCPDEAFAAAIIDDTVNTLYDGKVEIADLLKMFYLKSALSPSVESECPFGQAVSELLSDVWLNVPHVELGKLMARFDRELYIVFLNFYPEEHLYGGLLPPWVKTSFGDDVAYTWGWPYDQEAVEKWGIDFNSEDRQVAIIFMEMISSFASTGIPFSTLPTPEPVWQPFNTSEYNVFFLNECPSQGPFARGAEKDILWNTLIPDLVEALSEVEEPTPTPSLESCIVDGFLGLNLTSERAGRVIGALVITLAVIAGLVLLGIMMTLCLKRSRASASNKPV